MKSYKQMRQSHKETDEELYNAIRAGGGSIDIVNIVEEGNMSAVTSNAVAKAIKGETSIGTVDVIVTEKGTGLRIDDASVTLDETEQITTAGECKFENIDFGMHILKVACENYEDYIGIIRLNEEFKTVRIELSRDIEEYATLNIIVKNNSTGSSVEGAMVKVGNETLTTDSEGKCTFEDLQYTSYLINAYCNGYDDYVDSIFIEEKETDYILNMIPTQTTGNIRLVGTVLDGQGVLPEVTIKDKGQTATATSDKDGYYVLDVPKSSIEENIVHITMSKLYYELLEFDVSISDDEYYEIENKTLTLSSGIGESSGVMGKAQYQNYEIPTIMVGAGNVKMLFLNLTASGMYDCTTRENGEFEKLVIAPGKYNVKIEGNPDYLDQTISNAFFLRPNETLEDVTLDLMRITHDFQLVIVYKDSGEYITNTKVEIFSDSDTKEMIASGTTNETGKMNFTVSDSLTGDLYAKIYLTDVHTVNIGSARAFNAKVKI